MNFTLSTLLISCFLSFVSGSPLYAQSQVWSVDDCINYALQKNIQVQQANVSSEIDQIDLLYAKAAWLPSLSGSARESFSWGNQFNSTTGSSTFTGTNGTNFSLSSGMTLYNAGRIRNGVRQS